MALASRKPRIMSRARGRRPAATGPALRSTPRAVRPLVPDSTTAWPAAVAVPVLAGSDEKSRLMYSGHAAGDRGAARIGRPSL